MSRHGAAVLVCGALLLAGALAWGWLIWLVWS